MISVYVALVLVFVLAIAVLVGTALSRLGAMDCDLHEYDEDVDEADDAPATGDDRDRAKLRHPSAHQPTPAPGFGRGQAPHQRVFLPRPRSARER